MSKENNDQELLHKLSRELDKTIEEYTAGMLRINEKANFAGVSLREADFEVEKNGVDLMPILIKLTKIYATIGNLKTKLLKNSPK